MKGFSGDTVPTLRLHLPPNLAAAAARDAVALRIELDQAAAPDPGLIPVLALLQRWCGTPRPPPFIQLTRRQLRDLAAAAAGQPIFVENSGPGPWAHDALLDAPESPPAPAPPPTVPLRRARGSPAASEPLVVDGSEHYLAITLPSREDPRYGGALELLRDAGFVLEPSNRKWWLRDRHKTLSFLAAHGDRLRGELQAQLTPNFIARTSHLAAAEITCEVRPSGDGWDVSLGLRGGAAEDDAMREAISAGRAYLEAEGKVILIDPACVRRLADAQRALADGGPSTASARRTDHVGAARAVDVEAMLERLSPGFRPPEEWRVCTGALRNVTRLEAAPTPPLLASLLRPYQRLGAAWLWHLHRNGLGGVLADEMGLGKTLQALALLCAVRAGGGPSLVVCPSSLVENWRREAARFAPDLRVFVHLGDRRLRGPDDLSSWNLVVTSYGTLARDRDLLASFDFACVIGDEAQHVKNNLSQNAKALRSLRARGRFLLTGTPVENSLDDLRSLFDFILPGYLERVPQGARGDERAWLDERLRAKAAHYILRRTKQAVAPELPARIEQVVWCALGDAQAALYRSFHEKSERELFDLEASGAAEARLRLAALTQLLRLRQICCDPRLVAGQRDGPPGNAAGEPLGGSAKLEAFREILSEAADGGHRLLVFSQFTSLLALLREELLSQGVAHCYLDGSLSPAARQMEIDRFQASAEVPVFLLSLKAGGAGLNLTGADTVVHFDPWWNPAAEAQATDRAHRIGQSRVVTSYKLVCPETVEEKVLALQEKKRALLAGVFEASDAAAAGISLADLKSLLEAT
ncbi:MAG TPA: DEAD/DEAH box helicase [Opitutaceae bacterium]|nr:DEAD/DEAH box helicase [Opitutaceae bacterium]